MNLGQNALCMSDNNGVRDFVAKDAIGRWYCCNDSRVSVSSLGEVFSENVYILFFSRAKQRPVLPNKSLSTNGRNSHNCNGNDTSKVPKSSQQKSTDSQQPKADPATSSKVGKYLYIPQKKPVSFGFLGPKKSSNIITHNKENNDNNADAKALNSKKNDKKIPLLEDKNGSSLNSNVANGNVEIHRNGDELLANGSKNDATGNGTGACQNKHVANGNADIHSNGDELVANGCKNNVTRNGTETGNGIAKTLSDESDSQRRHEDQPSLAKHEELIESLKKEASAFLRNCGYSDEVASFMRAKKLSTQDECNNGLQRKELKRKMIDDAKESLIPQIPGSLKAELIKRIRFHIDQ